MKINFDQSMPSHINQYVNLFRSIKNKGLLRNDTDTGDITAEIYYKGNEWAWKIGGEGNHRAIAAASLDYKSLPVRVVKLIKYEDADIWPNVTSGLYTKDEALSIFDKVFYARPPSYFDQWIIIAKEKSALK